MYELLNDPEEGPTFTKLVIEQNATKVTTRKSFIDLFKVNSEVNSTSGVGNSRETFCTLIRS